MTEPAKVPASHVWAPIVDLSAEDLAEQSEELPLLSEVWHEELDRLDSEDAVKRFNERLKREWAIETGIIERLYTLDRGITQVLIERGIEASLIPDDATDRPPELVANLIGDQEKAVDFLFDLAADRRELSVSFIKELHALITRSQESTTAVDQFGREREVPLLRGEFKQWPNNPRRADGRIHEYCPPEHVASEMDRLIELHHLHMGNATPPDVESAWLHHRFTQIHPFQDGNGRIARALASLVLIQAHWFPLVITRDDRVAYIDALEEADRNGLGALIRLFAKRQKRDFVTSLSLAREVTREGNQLEQQLAAVSEMFDQRDQALRDELDAAKQTASVMWERALTRMSQVAKQLEQSMSSPGRNRHAFVDSSSADDVDRQWWYRWQIVEAAKELGYFASLYDFSAWVKVGIDTESGRSEILLSFHGIGRQYHGVVGCSMSFYRRQESPDGGRAITDRETISDEVFQINYKDSVAGVEPRFTRWLEEGLVRAIAAWQSGE